VRAHKRARARESGETATGEKREAVRPAELKAVEGVESEVEPAVQEPHVVGVARIASRRKAERRECRPSAEGRMAPGHRRALAAARKHGFGVRGKG